ncbi:MAG: F0F1 ATP synthase subunit alpha, partial [Desulfomonilia bacterium]|nr:F0F1 ATP synthase subunit alpha [Desulfomonilia bacterium]
VGISVSRVGGNAQIKAMKKVAGTLRLDLAQYRELAAFSQFGSDLDKATQAQLNRGARLMEMLKQPQYKPMPVERQVAIIYVGTNGYLDEYPVEAIRSFEEQFLTFMENKHSDILKTIRDSGTMDSDTEKSLKDAIVEFKKIFVAEE